MNKKYVFFDLDGTITDPKIGITKGVNEGLKRFSKQETDLNKLTKFIGPPLRASFKEFYNMTDEEAENAVSAYREYYKDIGIFEATVYDGLKELLDRLISSGLTLIVATSKPTIFAKRVIDHFGLSERFEEIIGCELTSVKDDKAVIIKEALEKCNANPSDVVMVGDRKFDILSAHQNGVKCISVTYGYGSQTEFLENKTDAIVDDFITLEHKIYEFLNV